MPLNFTVPPQYNGWLLRDFLRSCGVSTTAVRRAKRTPPGICADGVPLRADQPVRVGSVIQLPDVPESSPDICPQSLALNILWENEAAAVVEKPAGMAVHPTLNYADGTLANAWLGELERRGQTGCFHPVYRLDKDTSGVLVLAKSAVYEPFISRSCRKIYLAVVQGQLPQPCGTVETPIARCPDSIILRCVSPQGQPAVTRYRVLQTNSRYSLVAFSLLTGRTHQIRVHMASIGCPLLGDDLYGGSKQQVSRQALHCAAVSFVLPQGTQVQSFSAFPPELLSAAGLKDFVFEKEVLQGLLDDFDFLSGKEAVKA